MRLGNRLKLFVTALILIHSWIFNCNTWAQSSPYFKNFSKNDYSGGNQNWDVSQAKDGKLYVANKKGLLEYDGVAWNLWELPNKTIIRSVLAIDNRIYIGSLEEFGYWEKTKTGILKYRSITDNITIKNFNDQEIWEIFPFKDAIIFRSFSNIYTYKNGEVTASNYKEPIVSCNIIDNELYVATTTGTIWKFENNKFLPIETKFNSGESILKLVKTAEDEYFYATATHGCFTKKNNIIRPWKSEVNELLKNDELNKISYIPNGNFVFGTIKNGIYITNNRGDIIYHINRHLGLMNNTVLSLEVTDKNKLWVGLDNGIVEVDLDERIHFINDYSGKLGTVYDILEYKDKIYLGSNTGLFYLDKKKKLVFIKNSEGQVWDLEIINNQLFCGTNSGTYLVEGTVINKISNFSGGRVIKKVPDQNIFIQGTYNGLIKYEQENETWKIKELQDNNIHTENIVFEDTYNAWITHPQKGLYKVNFSNNFDIASITSLKDRGLPLDYNVGVYKLKNNIVFHSNNGWFKYEFLNDTIIPYESLNESFGIESDIISDNFDNSIVALNRDNTLILKSLKTDSITYIPKRYYQNRINEESLKVIKINDSTYGICLVNGVMFLKSSGYKNDRTIQVPEIERIWLKNELLDVSKNIELPYFYNSLALDLSSASSENHFFEYKLLPFDQVWKKIKKNKIEFNNLSDGKYNLLFRAGNDLHQKSTVNQIEILVNPPWYRDDMMIIIYALVLIIIYFLFYKYQKTRNLKRQKILHKNFIKKQQELLLQEKNKALEKELTNKSKQLSNTAIALVNKNEALLKLKDNIKSHEDDFYNKTRIDRLLSEINSIIGNDDEFKLFEHNFNKVHETFFIKLNEIFPDILTKRDLKLCAFTKMELSTKEIASLLNISTRSVETHKFRLKKKLNLEKEISLTNYLKNLI